MDPSSPCCETRFPTVVANAPYPTKTFTEREDFKVTAEMASGTVAEMQKFRGDGPSVLSYWAAVRACMEPD